MWNLLLEEVWLTSLNSKLFCFNSAGTLVVDICTYIVFIAPPPLYIHMYVHIYVCVYIYIYIYRLHLPSLFAFSFPSLGAVTNSKLPVSSRAQTQDIVLGEVAMVIWPILRDMYRSCSKRKRLREGDVVIEDTTYVCIGVVVADVTLPEFRKLMCPECEEFFCYDCSMEWHEGATCRGS